MAVGKGEGRRGGRRESAREREKGRERRERGTSPRGGERKRKCGKYGLDEPSEKITEADNKTFSQSWCAGVHISAETGC